MFYDITAHTKAIALATALCLFGKAYPGKDKISRESILNQRATTKHRHRYLYHPRRESAYKKTVQTSLYQSVCDKDIDAAKLILSSSKQIDTNKQYGFFQNTILHTAVMKNSPQLAALILNHPNTDQSIKNKGGRTALDMAISSGSHTMIKTFIHRRNFDPTKRDETGESTINKLKKRNVLWAEKLCQNMLKNRLQLDAKQAKSASTMDSKDAQTENNMSASDHEHHNTNNRTAHEALQCMICFETPTEILKIAASHPIDAYKKPEQLMSITTCCHGLLCTQDKTEWLHVSFSSNCPTCRQLL